MLAAHDRQSKAPAARQGSAANETPPRLSTHTIPRPAITTLAAVVIFASAGFASAAPAPSESDPAPSLIRAAAVDPSNPTATAVANAQPTQPVPTAGGGGGEDYIGAIVGCVVAFVFIVLLLWFCLVRPRMRPRIVREESRMTGSWYGSETDSYFSSADGDPRRPRPVRPRGGWPGGAVFFGFERRRPRQPILNPRPPEIPPTRWTGYTQTPQPQMAGVRTYP